MTPEEEREIRAASEPSAGAHAPLSLRHRRALLAEIDRLRARLDAAGAVVSEIGCDCTCHVPDVDEGEHDDDCDGPCSVCRIADALWPEQRRGGGR